VEGDVIDQVLSVDLRHPLRHFALDIRFTLGRETLALVGPSGAGKTSVLRAIAGLLRPESGRIVAGGRTLTDTVQRIMLPPEDRAVGMVFQDGALFPHLSVARNVAYGLRPRPRASRGPDDRVRRLLERFGIAGLAAARPAEISGGERQRVALARAVGRSPQVLLLDEPLSALDSVTKAQVSRELSRWLDELRLPAILVSHDYGDVAGLADRVIVVDKGSLVQDASLAELVRSPASSFVAAFTGVNHFAGTAKVVEGRTEVRLDPAGVVVTPQPATGRVGVVVDPWAIGLAAGSAGAAGPNTLTGPVLQVALLGGVVRVTVGSEPPVVADVPRARLNDLALERGDVVTASWDAADPRLHPLDDAARSSALPRSG
jgi:molybdate transport system ATP-binding protein